MAIISAAKKNIDHINEDLLSFVKVTHISLFYYKLLTINLNDDLFIFDYLSKMIKTILPWL